jgi:hypothetical protein
MAGGGTAVVLTGFRSVPLELYGLFPCSTALGENFPFATAQKERTVFLVERDRDEFAEREMETNGLEAVEVIKRALGWEACKCPPILYNQKFHEKWKIFRMASSAMLGRVAVIRTDGFGGT